MDLSNAHMGSNVGLQVELQLANLQFLRPLHSAHQVEANARATITASLVRVQRLVLLDKHVPLWTRAFHLCCVWPLPKQPLPDNVRLIQRSDAVWPLVVWGVSIWAALGAETLVTQTALLSSALGSLWTAQDRKSRLRPPFQRPRSAPLQSRVRHAQGCNALGVVIDASNIVRSVLPVTQRQRCVLLHPEQARNARPPRTRCVTECSANQMQIVGKV